MKSNRLAVLFFLLTSFVLAGCFGSQGTKEEEQMEKDKKVNINEPLEQGRLAVENTDKHVTPPTPEPIAPLEVIEWTGKKSDQWKEYDKLVDEQKFEAASTFVEKMMKEAKDNKNSEEWVRCLIRYVQLRMALHGYETAVRFLKEHEWPTDLLGSSVLNSYYSFSLINYTQMYSWEIGQRERIDTKGVVDLKAWTNEQIYAEAHKSFYEVWKHREQLGSHPIKILEEYVTANNYPRNIRGTIRDYLSYQWTQIFADTSSWRPEHSNQIFKLNLSELIEGTHADLLDPAEHPLKKLSYILYDLEKWHLEKGEKEAAFEARLTRLNLLHSNFTQEKDRALLKADLEKNLEGLKELEWWSQGMAQLADFIKSESSHDNFIRAHKVAKDGSSAFPDSFGGQRCRNIVQSIEQPSYDVQAMAVDGPDKDSIQINYKNLTKIYFRAYKVDLKKHIESADDYSIYPDHRYFHEIIKNKADFTWSEDLPETVDYKNHIKLVRHPMKDAGFYVVISSGRENFEQKDNVLRGLNMIVGDLAIVTKHVGSKAEVQILSGSTGKPLSGVDVYMYRYDYNRNHQKVSQRKTDTKGLVTFEGHQNQSYFILAKKGDHIALDANSIYFYGESYSYETKAALIYTDRSIYRPNQKLYFKVVAYRGDSRKGDLKTTPKAKFTIILRDGNYQEVAKKELITNDFGTASGEFDIPSGKLLGTWRLETLSYAGGAQIKVEEYKRPTFEAEIRDSETPLRLNKPAKLTGEVKYYFGMPVTNGKVAWKVTRSPIYPWWWSYYWWYGGSTNNKTETISTGDATLNDEGIFEVNFTPEADERLREDSKGLTYRYTLSAEVTDEGGETRTATKSFRLGFVAVEASYSSSTNFFLEAQKQSFTITRTNLDGSPLAGDANYRILSLIQPQKTLVPVDQPRLQPSKKQEGFSTPDDGKRTRWSPGYSPEAVLRTWKDGNEVVKGELKHPENGKVEVPLPDDLKGGVYRLYYTTKDAFGADYEMSQEFLVAGPKTHIALPAYLKVETNSVKVGGTARIFTGSGLEDQILFMDIYRNGKRTERRELDSGVSNTLIEIPVTEELRGGFSVQVLGIRDFQFMQFSKHIYVPWDNKELKIEFSTFRDRLKPGQEETWSVKITGPSGKDTPVKAAEVLAYMYDRSLDTFAPHNPPNPKALFPSFVGVQWPQVNIRAASLVYLSSYGFTPPEGWSHLNADVLKFYSGYGIGGLGRGGGFGEGGMMASPPMGIMMARTDSFDDSDGEPEPTEESGDFDKRDSEKLKQNEAAPSRERAEEKPVELRSNFSETAFFSPHLLTGEDGSVTIEFKVPDSVTSWNVWVHTITKDLESGSATKEAKTVKDLMVRPYLPRFLREGDKATLKVVVNNASENELSGHVNFDIIDPDTKESLSASFGLTKEQTTNLHFTVKANGGTNLSFPIITPSKVGLIAFKVTAVSGDFTDGELRPIPVLPGRMHLAQSRFVTLRDKERRELKFDDLVKNDDPTLINEQMVVTVDAQLFYSVLTALPYLVEYPYECTEQTLNRFISTGILASMYKDYPAIADMAKKMAERDTQYEQWDGNDPNRKMALEETPWLQMAQGGPETKDPLINVLDPKITKAHRDASLKKLEKLQTSSGGFPWFSGGPPSPYITLYLLHGFSKALEFGVEVPKDLIHKAWRYLYRHYIDEILSRMIEDDCCWEFVTFLNYTIVNYPDASWTGGVFSEKEKKVMLDFSFKHWKSHSPYLKGYLTLTLHRMDRKEDALLVWESVMDSAKTAEDQGTFWAPEDRAWLWYNDTIETHAFAIRTVMEVMPDSDKLDGLVLWILINKKLNHWKSTKATAEVIYSLAHYMKETKQLGVREAISVVAGDYSKTFEFLPDEYTGKKNQIVIPGDKVDHQVHSKIVVEKETKGFAFASATWHFSTEKMPDEDRGDYLAVSRIYFKRVKTGREVTLEPLAEGAKLEVGDEVEVHISLRSKHQMEYVHLRDPRPAGFEPMTITSQHKWNLGIYWYEEIRDSGTNFFFEHLPVGEYPFKYSIRATIAGTFKASPATVQPMYAPEFNAYSAGSVISIEE